MAQVRKKVLATIAIIAYINLVVFVSAMLVYSRFVSPPLPAGTYVLTNIDDRILSRFGTVVLIEQPVVDMFQNNVVVFANLSGSPGVAVVVSDRGSLKLKALVAGNLTPSALVALLEGSKHVYLNGEVVGVVASGSVSIDVENLLRSALGLGPTKALGEAMVEGAWFSARYVLPTSLVLSVVIYLIIQQGFRFKSRKLGGGS